VGFFILIGVLCVYFACKTGNVVFFKAIHVSIFLSHLDSFRMYVWYIMYVVHRCMYFCYTLFNICICRIFF
jgi:hypothetical protein